MNRPTADQVRSALVSDDPVFARGLVLAARDVIAEHCSNTWGYRVDTSAGVTPYKGICGCRECEWLTPISRLFLPEEMPAIKAPPMTAPGTRPTVWRTLLGLVGVGRPRSRPRP